MKTRWLGGIFLCTATLAPAAEPGLFELHAVAMVASDHTREYPEPMRGSVPEKILLETTVLLDQTAVKSASVEHSDAEKLPYVLIKLTDEGRKTFGDISTRYLDKRIGIVLDGQLQSAPVIRSQMLGGSMAISGNFTEEEAAQLVQKINRSVSH